MRARALGSPPICWHPRLQHLHLTTETMHQTKFNPPCFGSSPEMLCEPFPCDTVVRFAMCIQCGLGYTREIDSCATMPYGTCECNRWGRSPRCRGPNKVPAKDCLCFARRVSYQINVDRTSSPAVFEQTLDSQTGDGERIGATDDFEKCSCIPCL